MAYVAFPEPQPVESPGNTGWAERRRIHPEDIILRRHGYRIAGRPKKGQALWRGKDGVIVTHAEAMAAVNELKASEEAKPNDAEPTVEAGKGRVILS